MRLCGISFATMTAGVVLWAQQPQAPPAFRTGTDLVTVDAVVTDSHGQAVTGLTADNFQIKENGRLQKIAALSFITTPPVARRELDPVPTVPIRDVITNRTAPHSRAFAVVIDDMHLMVFHGERVRRVLIDLLGSIPGTDRVAVVFTGRSDLSVDLTDDRATQMQAVGRVDEALGFAMDLSPVVCGVKEVQRKHQALGSLDVLRNAVTILAKTRADERTVVWVSEGLNFDFSAMPIGDVAATINAARASPASLADANERHCGPDGLPSVKVSKSPLPGDPQENVADAQQVRRTLQDVLDTATRADVRVYTIDPRGSLTVDAEVTGYPATTAGALQSKATVQNDFLRTVASATGGLAAVQRSDLHGAVKEFLADSGSYYLLGYTPDPLVRDGLYHKIEVKVLRPGLRVRARKGYTAPEANPKPPTGTTALSTDLAAGDATGDISLAAFVAPLAASGKLTKTVVTIEVTYPGPAALPASISDDLQFDVVDADAEGKGTLVSRRAFHFAMTPTTTGDVTFLVNDVVDLRPGLTNLRVGVLSKVTGQVGTVAVPARIPNLSDDRLQMLSLIVGLEGAAEPALPGGALAGLLPFQPTLTRTFSAHETLRVFAPLAWGAQDDAATVTLSVTGPGASVTQTFSVPAAAAANGLRHAIVDHAVPLVTLATGSYILTVSVTLQGAKPITRSIGFRIGVP